MRFDVITIFPGFFSGPLDYGIVRRARETALADVFLHDLREFTADKHRTVDDRPFGGGEGMILKPEPLFDAVESLLGPLGDASRMPGMKSGAIQSQAEESSSTAIVLLSASGKLFRQDVARRFASLDRIVLLCGRYEGVDERVAEHLATDELSVGDFVLSGGEIAAALMMDAVTRLLPGALGNEASSVEESFSLLTGEPIAELLNGNLPAPNGRPVLLDYPQYTRPAEFRGWGIPEVLLSGNHEEIRRWRRQQAIEKTRRNRPDLLG
jgi:tRNA (guanine37-N1)-methyltransferase